MTIEEFAREVDSRWERRFKWLCGVAFLLLVFAIVGWMRTPETVVVFTEPTSEDVRNLQAEIAGKEDTIRHLSKQLTDLAADVQCCKYGVCAE